MCGSRTLSSVEAHPSALDPVHAKRTMVCDLAPGAGESRLLGLPQANVKRDV